MISYAFIFIQGTYITILISKIFLNVKSRNKVLATASIKLHFSHLMKCNLINLKSATLKY